MNCFLYALLDPFTGMVRYVGKAIEPKRRYYRHLLTRELKSPTHKNNWINSLKAAGVRPVLKILAQIDENNWKEMEIEAIRRGRAAGFDLTNVTNGGEGVSGYNFTDEHRKKISEAGKRRKPSAFHIQRIIETNKTRHLSQETRAKMGLAKRGNTWTRGIKRSDETKKKLSESKTGKGWSEETKAKMKAAKKNVGTDNPMFGKRHSEATKARWSEIRKGRKPTEEQRLKNSLGLKAAWARRKAQEQDANP